VTSDLCSRIAQHRDNGIPGFTKKYNVKTLVWFQYLDSMPAATERQKQLKEWKRAWKLELIENSNPDWRDLYPETCGQERRSPIFRHPGVRLDPGFQPA
jgi:putative endonuclease